VPEIWTAMNALDKKLGPVEWIPLVGATSGQFKLSVEATARAHANFMGALRQYKMAIEDLTYQAQLCAR
jgi:hypothetical protein